MKLLLATVFLFSMCCGFTQTNAAISGGNINSSSLALNQASEKQVINQLSVTDECTTINTAQTVTLCFGESLVLGTNSYSKTGNYIDTLTSKNGCDSIINTALKISEPIIIFQDATICFGETFEVGDSSYFMAGTYTNLLITESGCDSAIITYLEVEEQLLSHQTFTISEGETIVVGESLYTTAGIYENTFKSYYNCDSTVTTSIVKNSTIDTSKTLVITETNPKKNTLDKIAIYPNPSNGQFNIDLGEIDATDALVEVYDSTGKLIYSTPLLQGISTVNLTTIPAGIYLIRIANESHSVVQKIRIQ